MTAKDLRDRAGCMAAQFAEAAGYGRSYWDSAVSVGTGIPKKRRAALRAAIEKHIGDMQELIMDLHDDEPAA